MEAKVAIPKERKIDWDYDEEADRKAERRG